MTLQKIALSVVATVASLSLTPALQADTRIAVSGFGGTIVTPNVGIGVWIGGSAPERHVYRAPAYGHGYGYGYGHSYGHRGYGDYGPPWQRRFVRIGPPPVVVVRPPAPIVVQPAPPVVLDSTVTVWITNSNGSKTTVQLTRHNGWYVGPRGEYYDQMPTNEQLRLVYGF